MAAQFAQLTANGDTTIIKIQNTGWVTFWARGTFDSGTLTLKANFDGTNFDPITDGSNTASLLADGQHRVWLTAGLQIKATLSGAGSPTVDCGITS